MSVPSAFGFFPTAALFSTLSPTALPPHSQVRMKALKSEDQYFSPVSSGFCGDSFNLSSPSFHIP